MWPFDSNPLDPKTWPGSQLWGTDKPAITKKEAQTSGGLLDVLGLGAIPEGAGAGLGAIGTGAGNAFTGIGNIGTGIGSGFAYTGAGFGQAEAAIGQGLGSGLKTGLTLVAIAGFTYILMRGHKE